MALFKMSMCDGAERVITKCQMAFGCLVRYAYAENMAYIVAFDTSEAEIIKDSLVDIGSEYRGDWTF